MNGDGQLRAFIERILRLKEEQDSLAADIREIYAEAKGSGFDKTAIGQLVSHLRKVEKVGVAAVEEGQSTFDLYLSAYERATGTPIATHTHEASQSYAEAKPAVVKKSLTTESTAPSELTDTQEQPAEPATQSGLTNEVRSDALRSSEVGTLDQYASEYAGTSSDENPAPISNPQEPAASLGNADGPASTSSPEPGSLSDADVPAFLKAEQRKTVADYRPNCLHPDACGATGLTHCYTCRKAMEVASETKAA